MNECLIRIKNNLKNGKYELDSLFYESIQWYLNIHILNIEEFLGKYI